MALVVIEGLLLLLMLHEKESYQKNVARTN